MAATASVALQLVTAIGFNVGTSRSEAATAFGLTEREEEVLRLVAQGASNASVAAQLMISCNTVKAHVHSIMEKLNAHSRVEAVIHALDAGIVSGDNPSPEMDAPAEA
jgi:DNA-binding NarL/FixJ family response regulator